MNRMERLENIELNNILFRQNHAEIADDIFGSIRFFYNRGDRMPIRIHLKDINLLFTEKQDEEDNCYCFNSEVMKEVNLSVEHIESLLKNINPRLEKQKLKITFYDTFFEINEISFVFTTPPKNTCITLGQNTNDNWASPYITDNWIP